jgi:gamma-glutamyl hydrolase
MARAAVYLLLLVATAVYCLNERPIIGIIAQPYGHENANNTYIAASYVKWIESAGGRVVPIPFNVGKDRLKELFNGVNGLLFPGGGTDLDSSPYIHALEYLFELALEDNNKGNYFPVWGTCLGFEAVSRIVARDFGVLTWGYDAHNISWPLHFTEAAAKSKLFGSPLATRLDLLNIFAKQDVTMNNHQGGVDPAHFNANKYMSEFFRVLSTNTDKKGKTFISTMEGIKYPVYASQWHPEKQQFEWKSNEQMNHSFDSVIANQYIANFFVNEARKSNHRFTNEVKELIYNYSPVYSGAKGSDFEQTYLFSM